MVATLEKTLSHTAIKSFDKGLDLFFYDANLEGRDNLLPYISKDTKLVPIESSENFLTILSKYSSEKINNLYILCHGLAGELKIGSESVNTKALVEFSKNSSIYIDNISLLSCNVGQDLEFVKVLSETFSCVVNYSDKLVGHSSLGGSWDLNTFKDESVSNKIVPFSTNSLPFTEEVIKNWEHTLAITISAGQLAALVADPSSITGYSASSTITITGQITYTEASTLNSVAATTITATVAPTTATNLATITIRAGRTNNFTLTTTDTTATAAELNAVKAVTSLAPVFTSITGLESSPASAVVSLYADTNATLGNETVILSDTTVAAADLNTIAAATGAITATAATTITGTAAAVETAMQDGTITDNADVAVTITDTTVDAEAINDIDGLTTGLVTASSATAISGIYTEVNTALSANAATPATIAGLGAANVTLTDATVTVDQVNAIDANTTGIITATIAATETHAELATLTGTGNALTITTPAATATAAQLNTANGATTLAVNAAATTGIVTSSFADINTLYTAAAAGEITGLGNETITPGVAVTVAQANSLAGFTTGLVTATISDGDIATLSGLVSDTAADGTTAFPNALTITVTDTTVSAAALNVLDAKTTIDVDATATTTLTGTLADVVAAYAAEGAGETVNLDGDEAVTISDTGVISAADVNTINAATSGLVTLSGVTGLTGTAAAVTAAFTANSGAGGVTGLPLVTGSTVASGITATVTDASVAAETLEAIDAQTTGLVTVTGAAIEGNYTDVKAVLDANAATPATIAGLDAINVTLDASLAGTAGHVATATYAIANINTIAGLTTGTITAGVTETEVNTLIAADAIAESGHNLAITYATTGGAATIDAAKLITLNGLTNGLITVTAAGAISGTAADLKTVFAANADTPAATTQISGIGNNAVTVTGAQLDAADLITINAATTGLVTHAATSILGSYADIIACYTADEATPPTLAGTLNQAFFVNDSTIAAADTATLNGKTTGLVTFTATTLTGEIAPVTTALTASAAGTAIAGLGAANVTLAQTGGATTVANINAIDHLTTGVITATVTDNTAALLKTIGETGHNLTLSLTDGTVAAADITAIDALTTGTFSVTSTTVTGTAAQIIAAYGSSTVTGLGNEAIIVTGGASVADINTIAALSSGAVTATITDGTVSALTGITESGNNLSLTISDTGVLATDLTTIDAKTALPVDASAVTAITGTDTEITAAYALNTATTTTGLGNETLFVTNALTVAEANAIRGLTTNPINATISAGNLTGAGNLTALADDNGNPDVNGYTITVTDTTATAAQLTTLSARTTVAVNASAVTTITGTVAECDAALDENVAGTITGIGDVNVNFSGNASMAELITLDGLTTGLITGATNVVATALLIADNGATPPVNTGLVTGHAIAVTVDETTAGGAHTVSAADLITINSRTSGLVTVGATTITGLAADVKAVYATAATEMTGTGNEAVTLTDTSIAATDITSVDGSTTGVVTVNAATVTGTSAEVLAAYNQQGVAQGVLGLTAEAITISDAITVAEANVHAADTTGVVTATISDGDMATLANLTATDAGGNAESNAYTITVTDTTADAGDLNTLNGKTTVAVDLSALTSITGDHAELTTLMAANAATPATVTGLGNEAITISGDAGGNPLTVAEANTASGWTTGVVTATIETGSIATINGITETGNAFSFTVNDATVDAATLNNLRAKTTGVVTVSGNTINGTASDIGAIYAAQTAGTVAGLANETVTISDTGTVLASDLNTIDGITSVAVVATAVTGLSGTATAINAAYAAGAAGTITGLGNEAVTITGASTAADITTANTNTTGLVTVNSGSISGTYAEIVALYAANGTTIAGLGDEAITITDTSLTVTQANAVDALTTGSVTATISDNDIDTLASLTGTGNAYTITVTDTSVSASNLNTLDAKSTGTISVTSTDVSGSAADLVTLYAAQGSGLTGLGSETITVTSGLKASGVVASDLKLGVSFDANSYLASHTDVLAALGSSATSALTHYVGYGYSESRSLDSFSELSYIASYSDLITAFGANGGTAATSHYVSNGYSENRSADNFDELGYIASYADLITAIGASSTGAATHYITYGSSEGRTTTFDSASYLAAHADLKEAFGSNEELAKQHYINHGYTEGRALA